MIKAERLMAIFIGFIMIGSIIGFAMMNTAPVNTAQRSDISHIVKGPLDNEKVVFILRMGRVLIRDWYRENCTECKEDLKVLENFANTYKDYVVLEEVEIPPNDTLIQEKFEMIGREGKIRKLENITQESLVNTFCEIAMVQPKECLLKEI